MIASILEDKIVLLSCYILQLSTFCSSLHLYNILYHHHGINEKFALDLDLDILLKEKHEVNKIIASMDWIDVIMIFIVKILLILKLQ